MHNDDRSLPSEDSPGSHTELLDDSTEAPIEAQRDINDGDGEHQHDQRHNEPYFHNFHVTQWGALENVPCEGWVKYGPERVIVLSKLGKHERGPGSDPASEFLRRGFCFYGIPLAPGPVRVASLSDVAGIIINKINFFLFAILAMHDAQKALTTGDILRTLSVRFPRVQAYHEVFRTTLSEDLFRLSGLFCHPFGTNQAWTFRTPITWDDRDWNDSRLGEARVPSFQELRDFLPARTSQIRQSGYTSGGPSPASSMIPLTTQKHYVPIATGATYTFHPHDTGSDCALPELAALIVTVDQTFNLPPLLALHQKSDHHNLPSFASLNLERSINDGSSTLAPMLALHQKPHRLNLPSVASLNFKQSTNNGPSTAAPLHGLYKEPVELLPSFASWDFPLLKKHHRLDTATQGNLQPLYHTIL